MTDNALDKCLHFVSEILTVLKTSNEYEKVLHLIVDRLVRVYNCQTCAIILINPKTEFLSVENSFGLSWTFRKAFRRTLATGVVGELLWTGRPVVIRNSVLEPERALEWQLEHPFGSCIAAQITADHRTLGYLYADAKQVEQFSTADVHVLQAFADFAGIAIQKARLHDENVRMERMDQEPGLEKYGPFLEKMRASMERAEIFQEQFAIMILDVDNFKAMAHTYGHESSTHLLRELGELAKSHLRNVDASARFGSDEFILLLANTDIDRAVSVAKKITCATEQAMFTPDGIRSTVSIGVATYPESGHRIDELLLSAKNAVFEAQRAGRNKVFLYKRELAAEGAIPCETA